MSQCARTTAKDTLFFHPIWFGLELKRVFVLKVCFQCQVRTTNVGVCQLLLLLKILYKASNVCSSYQQQQQNEANRQKETRKTTDNCVCAVFFSVQSVFGTGFMHISIKHYAVWLQPAAAAASNKSSHQHKACVNVCLFCLVQFIFFYTSSFVRLFAIRSKFFFSSSSFCYFVSHICVNMQTEMNIY